MQAALDIGAQAPEKDLVRCAAIVGVLAIVLDLDSSFTYSPLSPLKTVIPAAFSGVAMAKPARPTGSAVRHLFNITLLLFACYMAGKILVRWDHRPGSHQAKPTSCMTCVIHLT
jgi:hypothetical protein